MSLEIYQLVLDPGAVASIGWVGKDGKVKLLLVTAETMDDLAGDRATTVARTIVEPKRIGFRVEDK